MKGWKLIKGNKIHLFFSFVIIMKNPSFTWNNHKTVLQMSFKWWEEDEGLIEENYIISGW